MYGIKTLINIESTEDSLEQIGEDIWILCTACISFSKRHENHLIELVVKRYSGKMSASDIATPEIRHPTFVFFRIFFKDKMCHGELQSSISEKFESFIMLRDFIFIQKRSMNTRSLIEGNVDRKNPQRLKYFRNFWKKISHSFRESERGSK
jgi:hypothetical protein